MDERYILAFDLGTTMIKLVLFDQRGNTLYEDNYNLQNYEEDCHQFQKAEDWWEGIKSLSHGLNDTDIDVNKIAAIVSTGQMEDCLLLDRKGNVLSEVLLYSDGRAKEEFNFIIEKLGKEKLDEVIGNNFDPLMSINKYFWLKNNRPKEYSEHAHLILGAKDYLNFRLTGNNVTDYTNASTTGFMNIKKGKWSQFILRGLGIDIDKLPSLKKATAIIGKVKKDVAKELKIPQGIPVINGSGDVGASTLGAGAWNKGDIYCYLGTTGWMASPTDQISNNNNIFTLSNIDGKGYILAGAILNAGKSYDWYLTKIVGSLSENEYLAAEDYRRNEEKIAELNSAKEGLFFLPFLNGERSPIKISEKSGAFVGLGPETDKYLLLRSVLEGVTFSLKHNLIEIIGVNKDIKQLSLIGGGSKSSIWPQIISDILNIKVNVLDLEIGAPSMGAALIAYKALKWINDYLDYNKEFKIKKMFKPQTENVQIYEEAFEEYLKYLNKLYR